MTDRLAEIGKVLNGIHESVKTAKSLQGKNGEMSRMVEETKSQAAAIEDLQIPNEPLLQDLKKSVRKARESISGLQVWLKNLSSEISAFEKFLKERIHGSSIPPDVIPELCEAMKKIQKIGHDFTESFETFAKQLSKAQLRATKLTNKLQEMEQEMQKKADSSRNWGAAGTAGLVLAGAGLAALGFFTGGVAWAVAGGLAGAAAAAAVGTKTAFDVSHMREVAGGILKDANKLDAISKRLKDSCDKAGEIRLDKEAMEALETAIEFFRRDQEKDAEIAELKEKLRSLGH